MLSEYTLGLECEKAVSIAKIAAMSEAFGVCHDADNPEAEYELLESWLDESS